MLYIAYATNNSDGKKNENRQGKHSDIVVLFSV